MPKVEYDNKLNTFHGLPKLGPDGLALMSSLLVRLYGCGTESVETTYYDLKNLAGLQSRSSNQITKALDRLTSSLLSVYCRNVSNDGKIIKFSLFDEFIIDPEGRTLTASVSRKFEFLLNNLGPEVTEYELTELITLRTSYSMTLYQNLKQHKTTGLYAVSVDDFRAVYDVPDSYKFSHINERILQPSMEECSRYFEDLWLEKRTNGQPRRLGGARVNLLRFHFKPQQKDSDTRRQLKKEEVAITQNGAEQLAREQLQKAFEEIAADPLYQ